MIAFSVFFSAQECYRLLTDLLLKHLILDILNLINPTSKQFFLYTLKKSSKAVIFETLSQKYKNICYYGFDFWKKRKTSKC